MTGPASISKNKAQQHRLKLQKSSRELKKIQRELELSVRMLKPIWKDEIGQQVQQDYLAISEELQQSESRLNVLVKIYQQIAKGVAPEATRRRTGEGKQLS